MLVNPVNGSKNKDFDSSKCSQATKQESRETGETLRHHSRQPARALNHFCESVCFKEPVQ